MKTLLIKIRFILLPFLAVTFCTAILIAFLKWILAIRFQVFDFNEKAWDFYLPCLGIISILIWVRPRIRILQFTKKHGDKIFALNLIACFTVAIMAGLVTSYITKSTAKLKLIRSIEDVSKTNDRYFSVEAFSVRPEFALGRPDFRASGKNNQYLDLYLYFVVPFKTEQNDSSVKNTKYWYGVKFQKQISNNLPGEQKDALYRDFIADTREKMNSYAFDSLDHFEKIPNSDDRNFFVKAVQSRIHDSSVDDLVIMRPVFNSFSGRKGNLLSWIFATAGIGSLFLIGLMATAKYDQPVHAQLMTGEKLDPDDFDGMIKFLVPKGDHFMTSLLIDLNLLVFLMMIFNGVPLMSPNALELSNWGGNFAPYVSRGEWWRLFSCIFVHAGLLHLASNIGGLVIGGMYAEPVLGRKKYLAVYLIAGLGGSVLSMLWHPFSVGVGASGAIFGIFGALLGLALLKRLPKELNKTALIFGGIYIGGNLLYGLTGNIDNAAHIGGLIAGGLAGIALYNPIQPDDEFDYYPVKPKEAEGDNA